MKKSYDESVFLDYIRVLRREKNITQKEVAEKLGISRSMYARLEGGLSSWLPYLDLLLQAMGEEVKSFFPYDLDYFTNQRLFLYMLLFGVESKTVAAAFGIKTRQIKNLLRIDKKIYLVQYKEEMEKLFPRLYTVELDMEIQLAGNNSVILKFGTKEYVFLNAIGKNKKDIFYDFIEK